MRIREIVDEFLDYRAYVSHTLIKHRLFLGLNTLQGARLRLSDAAVWPLAADESLYLATLSKTLFGLRNPLLEEAFAESVTLCRKLAEDQKALETGDDTAFKRFAANARRLSDRLSAVPELLEKQTPGFAQDAVADYLNGRSAGDFALQMQAKVGGDLVALLKTVVEGGSAWQAAYRRFWGVSAEAYRLARCSVVANAAAEAGREGLSGIRSGQRMLRQVERIVSCWSPSVSDSDRPEHVTRTLRAEGFMSQTAMIEQLRSLGNSR